MKLACLVSAVAIFKPETYVILSSMILKSIWNIENMRRKQKKRTNFVTYYVSIYFFSLNGR